MHDVTDPLRSSALIKRVTVFGVGLIGGSFALALKAVHGVEHVVGVSRRRETLDQALELGIIDEGADDIAQAMRGADLVLIAVPVAQTRTTFEALLPHLDESTVITDAGSTKGDVVATARAILGPHFDRFVPGHPIAGREINGPAAALPGLFRGRKVVLTPEAQTSEQAIALVRSAWQLCGASVLTMSPEGHDDVLASVSHLPHILAYALVLQILDEPDAEARFGLAGGGFRDFTRIAASSPEMWRDISIANRERLLEQIDGYTEVLAHLRNCIRNADAAALDVLFARASARRLNWEPAQ